MTILNFSKWQPSYVLPNCCTHVVCITHEDFFDGLYHCAKLIWLELVQVSIICNFYYFGI